MTRKKVMDLIMGIDIGNSFSKMDNGKSLVSRISLVDSEQNYKSDDSYNVIYEGTRCLVGDDKGTPVTGIEKYKTIEYEILLLTSIVASLSKADRESKDIINAGVVIGIPAQRFNEYKEAYKTHALSIKNKTINVDGKDYTINIDSCTVLPQSGAVLSLMPDQFPSIVFDFGGGTLDITVWKLKDGGLVNDYTITFDDLGFDQAVEHFSELEKLGINTKYRDVLKMMDNPIHKNLKGQIDRTPSLTTALDKYGSKLKGELIKAQLPLEDIVTGFIVGGCSHLVTSYLHNILGLDEGMLEIPVNPQFSNAEMFKLHGVNVFGARETEDEVVEEDED